MKKVLFVATVVKMHIEVFHLPYLKYFKENGYEVHVCAKNDYTNKEELHLPYCDKYFDIPIERSPLSPKNIIAYRRLKSIIKSNSYDIIHCHTPMGGVLARLAARKLRKNGTKVIYTAHGFHFFRGSPKKNWILFYPVERYLSRFTDILITINKEDYDLAKKFHSNQLTFVPGVGVDVKKFMDCKVDIKRKRSELGISDEDICLLSVGELSKRKNHEVVIRALAKLNNPNIIYVICGQGDLEEYLRNLANDLKVSVKLLGFRKDIFEICSSADIFVFPSFQEGLPVALMEAMSAGLPVVCSDIRGNTDLIEKDNGGYLVNPTDIIGFKNSIDNLVKDKNLRKKMGSFNQKKVEKYDKEIVVKKMEEIYRGLK